jgi:hypothetical protein
MTAGFFDGDGCIQTGSNSSGLAVVFAQSGNAIPLCLQYYKHWYGGVIYTTILKSDKHRNAYRLFIGSVNALPILDIIIRKSVLKRPQAELAYQYLITKDNLNRVDLLRQIRTQKQEYTEITILPEKLTASYVAGLFDAEGTVAYNGTSISCGITQRSSPNMHCSAYGVLAAQFTKTAAVGSGMQR